MTTVQCMATDASGNVASSSFTVTVRGAKAQLADLQQAVTGVAGHSFESQVEAAQDALARDNIHAACGALNAFAHHVLAQSGKHLAAPQASQLLADATRIGNVMDC